MKWQGIKSIYRSWLHVYILGDIKKTVPFTLASKRIKYLKLIFSETLKNLHLENSKTPIKEIEDTKKWKDISCSWTGVVNIVKMSMLLKAIYRFNAIPIKLQHYFTETEQMILIVAWKHKTVNSQSNLEKDEQSIMRLNFKLYFKTRIIKTMWRWHENRNTDQWNRAKNPK